jgi:hypothetical protein
MTEATLVKSVGNRRFDIDLLQVDSGKFYIRYTNSETGASDFSEAINDYGTATYMFDLKLMELEGN